jgi:stage III sporulation protein AH
VQRKYVWMACLLVLAGLLYWLVAVEKQISSWDIVPDENPKIPSVFSDFTPILDDWQLEEADAFYVEYRLQRDRVRSQEMETLIDLINNPNVTADGKARAEDQLLRLVDMMEKELLVENLVKAQGFRDAIFFLRGNKAHLVIKAKNLNQAQFAQLSEMVSIVAGIGMEDVVIIENAGK